MSAMTNKRVIGAAALLVAVAATSGCATVTRGKSGEVAFTSVPAGVNVTTSLGTSCVTPCEMTVRRKKSFTATFKKGQEQRVVNVRPQASAEGVATGAGNIIVGGVVGIAVDAGTGANLDHFPNPVHANFNTPADQAQAVAQSHAINLKKAQAEARAAENATPKPETPRN